MQVDGLSNKLQEAHALHSEWVLNAQRHQAEAKQELNTVGQQCVELTRQLQQAQAERDRVAALFTASHLGRDGVVKGLREQLLKVSDEAEQSHRSRMLAEQELYALSCKYERSEESVAESADATERLSTLVDENHAMAAYVKDLEARLAEEEASHHAERDSTLAGWAATEAELRESLDEARSALARSKFRNAKGPPWPEDLKKMLAEAEAKHAVLQADNDALREALRNYEENHALMQEGRDVATTERDTVVSNAMAAYDELSACRERILALEEEVAKNEGALDALDNETSELVAAANANAEAARAGTVRTQAERVAELEAMAAAMAALQVQLEKSRRATGDMETRALAAETAAAELALERSVAQESLVEMQKLLTVYEARYEKAEAALDAVLEDRLDLQNALEALEQERDRLLEIVSEGDAKYEEMLTHLTVYEARYEKAEASLEATLEDRLKLSNALEQMTAERNEAEVRYQEVVETMEAAMAKAVHEMQAYQHQTYRVEATCKHLEALLAQAVGGEEAARLATAAASASAIAEGKRQTEAAAAAAVCTAEALAAAEGDADTMAAAMAHASELEKALTVVTAERDLLGDLWHQTSKAAEADRAAAADAAAASAAAIAAGEAECSRLQRSLEKAFSKIAELRDARNRAAMAAEAETEVAAAAQAAALNEQLSAELEDAEADRDAARAALAKLKATLASVDVDDGSERSNAVLKALLAVRTEQRDELSAQLADAASRHGASGEEGLAERLTIVIHQRDALQAQLMRTQSAEELLQSSDSFLAEMLSNLKVDRDELAAALLEAQAELRRLEAEAMATEAIVLRAEAEGRSVEERAEELAEALTATATRKYLEERDRANEELAAMWARQDAVRAEMLAARATAKEAEVCIAAARQAALLEAEGAAAAAAQRVAAAEAAARDAAAAAVAAEAGAFDVSEQLARLFLSLAHMRNERDAALEKLDADERRKRLEQARRSPPASRAQLTSSTVTTTAERLLQQNDHITHVLDDNSRLAQEFSELAEYASALKDKLKRAQHAVVTHPAAALLAREAAVAKQLSYTQQQLRDAHAKVHRLESVNASTRSELQFRLQQHESHLQRLVAELAAKVAAIRSGPPSPTTPGHSNGLSNGTRSAAEAPASPQAGSGLMVALKETFWVSCAGHGSESPRTVTETLELESQLKKYKLALKDLNGKLARLQREPEMEEAASPLSVNDVALVEIHAEKHRGCFP
jgi:chromosome segregation ATPase